MTAFTPIAFVDVWALSASLRSKLGLFGDDGIFEARLAEKWSPEMQNWNSLRNVLGKIRRLPAAKDYEIGDVHLRRLDPGQETLWSGRDEGDEKEVQLAIVTNPDCFLFAGLASQHFPVGHLIWINRALPRCAVNWGQAPRYHLIIEFQQKGEPDQ